MMCKKRISLTFGMDILSRESTPSTLRYDGYLKILSLLNLFRLFLKGEGGEVLKVKLDNVKACNKECHSLCDVLLETGLQ